MAVTYSYALKEIKTTNQTGLDGQPRPDAIIEIIWALIGTADDGYSGMQVGVLSLTAENTSLENYINFSDITQETIMNWIEESNAEDLENIKEAIDREIEKARNPVVSRQFPWL